MFSYIKKNKSFLNFSDFREISQIYQVFPGL